MKEGTTSETMSRSVTWAYCPNCGHLYEAYCKHCIPTDTMGWEHRQAIMRCFRTTALLCLLITGLAFTGICCAKDRISQGITREITIKKNCVSNAFGVAFALHNTGGFDWSEIRAAFSPGGGHVWIEGLVEGKWEAFSEHGMTEIWQNKGVTNGLPTDHYLSIPDFLAQQWGIMPKEKVR